MNSCRERNISEMFWKKNFVLYSLFFKKSAIYGIMWKNMVQTDSS